MFSKKFLIVDDDKDDCDIFIEALSSIDTDNSSYCANDGNDALAMLEHNNQIPDIIFLDINMPIMNGWECLEKLKSNENFKHIPVIVYTTSSLGKDRVLARKLGADCFVTKMFDFKKIRKMLEIVIEQMTRGNSSDICEMIYKSLSLN